ncbi:MAG: ABC transporter permease [Dysgonomonas sp.]
MNEKTGIIAVFKRECKRIISSKICIWGIFATPILSVAILMYMMNTGLPTKTPIAVVDLDNTATTRTLIRQLDGFPKTDIKFKSLSFREARQKMEKGEIYAVLTIPQNFTQDALAGNQPKLVYYTNNAFMISGSLLFQDLKTISTLASASVGLKSGEARGYTQLQLMPIIQPISAEAHPLNNPWLNYSVYLNNVLLAGILQLVIFMFTASSFGSEVKAGTGSYLLQLSGNSIIKTIIGKLLPYTIIYTGIALMFMSVLYKFSHFPLHSGFWPMFLNYFCLIIASQGAGLIFVGVFRNYRMALSSASLVGMISFSITGFSFSALQMSPILTSLSYIFPLRHFFLIYVDQGLNGIPIGYSAYHYAALIGFMGISTLLFGQIRSILKDDKYEP